MSSILNYRCCRLLDQGRKGERRKKLKSKREKKEEVAEEQRHKGTKNMEKVPVIPKHDTQYSARNTN